MNVQQLRNLLEDLDDETEVRFMSQPSWPFEYSILGTWQPPVDDGTCDACGMAREGHDDEAPEGTVWDAGLAGYVPAEDYDPIEGAGSPPPPTAKQVERLPYAQGGPKRNDHVFDDEPFKPEGSPESVVYLVEGTQLAYGTKRAFEEVERAW